MIWYLPLRLVPGLRSHSGLLRIRHTVTPLHLLLFPCRFVPFFLPLIYRFLPSLTGGYLAVRFTPLYLTPFFSTLPVGCPGSPLRGWLGYNRSYRRLCRALLGGYFRARAHHTHHAPGYITPAPGVRRWVNHTPTHPPFPVVYRDMTARYAPRRLPLWFPLTGQLGWLPYVVTLHLPFRLRWIPPPTPRLVGSLPHTFWLNTIWDLTPPPRVAVHGSLTFLPLPVTI